VRKKEYFFSLNLQKIHSPIKKLFEYNPQIKIKSNPNKKKFKKIQFQWKSNQTSHLSHFFQSLLSLHYYSNGDFTIKYDNIYKAIEKKKEEVKK